MCAALCGCLAARVLCVSKVVAVREVQAWWVRRERAKEKSPMAISHARCEGEGAERQGGLPSPMSRMRSVGENGIPCFWLYRGEFLQVEVLGLVPLGGLAGLDGLRYGCVGCFLSLDFFVLPIFRLEASGGHE